MTLLTLTHLTDDELTRAIADLARAGRQTTVELVRHLAELDSRRLHLAAGFPSLFEYCLRVLHLSEHETCNRIEAARACVEFPVILEALGDGRLSLTTVRLLKPHLTAANHRELLDAAVHMRKRDVLELIARRFPRPDIATSIRLLPNPERADAAAPRPGASGWVDSATVAPVAPVATAPVRAEPPRPVTLMPLSADRCVFRFTAPAEARAQLRQVQDLLRHAIPTGDVGEIFVRALGLLIEDAVRRKVAEVPAPRLQATGRPGSRQIPAEVRRTVWRRDSGRCAFVAGNGRRCGTTALLEFHHIKPYAAGGPPTPENIALRCRAHNAYEADLFFAPMRRVEVPSSA